MDEKNAFTKCPVCGKQNIGIKSVQVLFEDVRYDIMACADCESIWKAYYKVSNPKIEILKGPITTETQTEEPVESTCETTDNTNYENVVAE